MDWIGCWLEGCVYLGIQYVEGGSGCMEFVGETDHGSLIFSHWSKLAAERGN
jgi:hypothetical protein